MDATLTQLLQALYDLTIKVAALREETVKLQSALAKTEEKE